MSMTTKSFDAILADMKARNTTGLNTEEGGFVDAVLRPVAYALAAWNFDLAALAKQISPDTGTGEFLENQAKDYGIERKTGSRATATVTFQGGDGTVIPAKTAVQTRSGLVFLTDTETVIENGTATAQVTAEYVGAVCNVSADAICVMQSLSAVTVTSSTAADGGSDVETDDELRQRLRFVRIYTPASCNAAQYEAWATETPDADIGKAKAIGRWNGPGTVKLLLLNGKMKPASKEDVQAVQEHIEPLRELCTAVTCEAAKVQELSVAAKIVVADGASAESIKGMFGLLLEAYFAGLALTGNPVVYNRIAYMLLSIDGVLDFTELKINGAEENVEIAEDSAAVLKAVTVE